MKKIGLLYVGEMEGRFGTTFEVYKDLYTGVRFMVRGGLTSFSGK